MNEPNEEYISIDVLSELYPFFDDSTVTVGICVTSLVDSKPKAENDKPSAITVLTVAIEMFPV